MRVLNLVGPFIVSSTYLQEELDITADKFREVAVLGAILTHHYTSVIFVEFGINYCPADGTQASDCGW
jgi:hypothetical protein